MSERFWPSWSVFWGQWCFYFVINYHGSTATWCFPDFPSCCDPAASDYGMRLPILRSSPEDQILYQTERYNEDTFGYEIPIREEGDYILVMKYAEVYFAQSQQKVTWRWGSSDCESTESPPPMFWFVWFLLSRSRLVFQLESPPPLNIWCVRYCYSTFRGLLMLFNVPPSYCCSISSE